MLMSLSIGNRSGLAVATLAAALLLSACGGSSSPTPRDPQPTGDFELRDVNVASSLVEGDGNGISIPIELVRGNGYSGAVNLELLGESSADAEYLSATFNPVTLTGNQTSSTLTLRMQIGRAPILAQQRTFTVVASDGTDSDQLPIDINITPVQRPDVYLLAGQSNMVGFSGDGTRQAGAGGPDEPVDRILQLNVSKNDENVVFTTPASYTSASVNVVQPNVLVRAEDPLHIPQDPNNTGKDLEYIGLGLSFAKAALPNTTQEIILVPAAWSGSSFCSNEEGPGGNWNADATTDPNLGNTLLFDRAVTRVNLALEQSGGILRGILWHQGESDSNDRCAAQYQANLDNLLRSLRSDIRVDARGVAARGPDAQIPIVVGTMSRGSDSLGDFSNYGESKQLVDDAHRSIEQRINMSAVSNHDDLIPANGYPCGNDGCIHFGAAALREMGSRYYTALRNALARE